MKRTEISSLYKNVSLYSNKNVTICGWVKTIRNSKVLGFIDLNDGSYFKGVQVVFLEENLENFKDVSKLNVGASICVEGILEETPDAKQPFEIKAKKVIIEGESTSDYPLQKKRHTMEYLRTIAHLRPRTNTFGAAFRVRSAAAFAIHKFFNENGFVYAHTPIITGSDCEGAGEMFTVSALELDELPKKEDGKVDFSKDFFQKHTSLTVSGQLEGECMAMALGKIYTFGPTFRAEKSYTQRHAAEFWMIEPEMAFADLADNREIAEKMIKFIINYVLENCSEDMKFFNEFFDKDLIERLSSIVTSDFGVVTYTDAIEILEKNNENFEYKVSWGIDLQTEHERYLTEQIYKKPLFVINYPKEIKSFYMRENEDGKTVAAMDLLVPGIGEIIGGSQREERLDKILARMEELKLNEEDYWWYLDLRRYGTATHSGFGLGFERLIMYLTGIQNIRDVLPFPRTTGVAEF
ncbi:MAG: Asparagine--tRNA ligase [Eubacteriales bacterium SKADARSKE-1]|nr:Asparagine--tRNA ligase [Eubacteriales bacterium SKADARSKE-1]